MQARSLFGGIPIHRVTEAHGTNADVQLRGKIVKKTTKSWTSACAVSIVGTKDRTKEGRSIYNIKRICKKENESHKKLQ